MRVLGFLLSAALLIAICGCEHYHRGTYAMVTTEAVPHRYVTALGQRVSGEYCVRRTRFGPDEDDGVNMYRKAALNALTKAPGANALIDVEISLTPRGCARIEGKPVTLHSSRGQPGA